MGIEFSRKVESSRCCSSGAESNLLNPRSDSLLPRGQPGWLVLSAGLDWSYFPELIGKLQRDVTDDKEVLRDWDFPLIHRTVDRNSCCLEASVGSVYYS